jgi:hypothetical protein
VFDAVAADAITSEWSVGRTVDHDRAKNVRDERIDGIVHLYRHDDIIATISHLAGKAAEVPPSAMRR